MNEAKKIDANEGLNNPPINKLEVMAGCRYRLVSAVAKRARELMDEKNGKKKDVASKDVPKENRILLSDNEALDTAINQFYKGDYKIVQDDTEK